MAIIDYKNLDLKRDNSQSKFTWNGIDITVTDYLPIDSKYDIVMITLQKSLEDGYYNPLKLDMYYHLNLIYMYTNIVFSDEDRADENKLYDEIKSSGFLDVFLNVMNQSEYSEMLNYIEEISEINQKYFTSAASILSRFTEDLPGQLQNAQEIVDNFDKDKYQAVIDFAKAANNGKAPK